MSTGSNPVCGTINQIKRIMARKNYIPHPRQKYGLRKDGLKEAFTNIPTGDIRSYPLVDSNVSSFRTRATEWNKKAGYTKYSVSVDMMTGTLRVRNNG